MERHDVESSQIKSIGYERHDCEIIGILEVEFKGGSVYQYKNVSQENFDAFMAAESKGIYFGSKIKSDPINYPFTKVRGTDKEMAKAGAA